MKTPVVVVGNGLNALGVVRSLGRHSPCHLLASDQQAPAFHSRFCTSTLVTKTFGLELIAALKEFAKQFNIKPILLLTEEKSVETVAENHSSLSEIYQLTLPEAHLVTGLQDKDQFYQLAVEHDAPVPKTFLLTSSEDLTKVKNFPFPCALKPFEQDATYYQSFKKAYRIESYESLCELYPTIEPTMPRMIVQQWIEGQDSAIYFVLGFYDSESNPVSSFTGRKLRSWPVQVGGTASCVTEIEHAEQLASITHAFFKSIGLTGLAGMEFKRDEITGHMLIVEPTVGRTDFQHEIATLAGINVLQSAVSYLNGEERTGNGTIKNVVWKESIADELSVLNGSPSGYPNHHKIYDALFRWNDPVPYVLQFARRIKKKLGR